MCCFRCSDLSGWNWTCLQRKKVYNTRTCRCKDINRCVKYNILFRFYKAKQHNQCQNLKNQCADGNIQVIFCGGKVPLCPQGIAQDNTALHPKQRRISVEGWQLNKYCQRCIGNQSRDHVDEHQLADQLIRLLCILPLFSKLSCAVSNNSKRSKQCKITDD